MVETHEGDWARLVGSEGKSLKREEILPVNGRPRGWVDSRRLGVLFIEVVDS